MRGVDQHQIEVIYQSIIDGTPEHSGALASRLWLQLSSSNHCLMASNSLVTVRKVRISFRRLPASMIDKQATTMLR